MTCIPVRKIWLRRERLAIAQIIRTCVLICQPKFQVTDAPAFLDRREGIKKNNGWLGDFRLFGSLLWKFFCTLFENLHDLLDRVPIACGRSDTELFLELAEAADRFHLSTIQAKNESVLDGNDLQQPVIVR